MFRKIHSNKAPDATLGAELKSELGKYFEHVGSYCRNVLRKYPIPLFSIMVISILLSAILSFTVMRIKKPDRISVSQKQAKGEVNDVNEMMTAYQALKEVTTLQNRIEILGRKDTLSIADSIEFVQSLKTMEEIRNKVKSQLKPK